MQLTDAEIREILARRKIQKRQRQRRRRRNTLIALLLIIVLGAGIYWFIGHKGKLGKKGSGSGSEEKPKAYTGEIRGTIFIDPGHGGMDSGSDDDKDRYEKGDTLKLGLAVRDQLELLGFKVGMTRTEDIQVDRTERGLMANKADAQLFVSIHRNKADTGGDGVEGFIPKKNDKESRMLGENIMHFLGRAGFTERSIRAGTLQSTNDDYEENAAASMPSVLIEVGFLSNAADNERFDMNLDRNARAVANGIDLTFMEIYEPEKAEAYKKVIEAADAASKDVTGKVTTATEELAKATGSMLPAKRESTGAGIDPQAPAPEGSDDE